MMRIWMLVLGTLNLTAGQPGVPVEFIGGTLPGLAPHSSARLYLPAPDALVLQCGRTELTIPYQKIVTVKYGQDAEHASVGAILIAPTRLLSKLRKHFVTISYTDADGQPQALVIRVEKGDIHTVLAVLEARSGRPVEYQDPDARKSRSSDTSQRK